MVELKRTTCSRDCPDACSILVEVEGGRAVRLRGDPEDPVTAGFLCERTSHFLERQYAPERFTQPMLRVDGSLEPISWDAALDLAAQKLRSARSEFGPASIFHYRGGGSLGILKLVADQVFEAFGPVSIKEGDVCSGAGLAAQERDFGQSESHDVFDLLNSRRIVIWGKNPHVSGVHLLPVLNQARRQGTELLGIDPVRTRLAEMCSEFLQPRPGSDAALALAMARHLFDIDAVDPRAAAGAHNFADYRRLVHRRSVAEWMQDTDLDPAHAGSFAERIADGPTAILVGWGMARRGNGSATVRCLDALGYLSGNIGVPGGGVSYFFGRRTAFETGFVSGDAARRFSEARLGQELLAASDPPVRVSWVTAGNPISMLPDSQAVRRAFEGIDFRIVVETHPTDTTDQADLILPTLSLLEDDDLLGAFGNHWLRESRPAIAAPEGCWHEIKVLRELAIRLGLPDLIPASIEQCKKVLLRRLEARGVAREDFRSGAVRNPFAPAILYEDFRFPTPSGKAELIAEEPPPLARDGLLLMAVSDSRAQSSQWMNSLRDLPLEATVHPEVARPLVDGQAARLSTEFGSLIVVVRTDATLRRDLVLLPKGGMLRDGRGINALIGAAETDAGGGAVYYDTPVRLEALTQSS